MAKERVVVVDGSSLIYRAYYALPGHLSTSHGLHTNAILGFLNMFRKLLAGKRPAFGAVAFDPPGPTFRSEKYPQYKADRSPMPSDLKEQLPWIDKVVAAFGFPALREPGFEADDVIGTLTRLALEAGHEVIIVSGDKDFVQLIGPDVRMLDTLKDVTYDAELARKKWGVKPEQFVDYLALMGDKVDNIPGVPGIGKKGAATLLEAHGDLDGVLKAVESLKGRAKKALTDHKDLALLSRDLATIDRNVPLTVGIADLAIPEVEQQSLNDLYRELEFYRLLSDDVRAEDADGDRAVSYTACADAAAAEAALTDAAAVGPVSLVPAFDPQLPNHPRLCGLAFSSAPGKAAYVALGADALADDAFAFLRAYLEDDTAKKVCHDAKALWVGLRRQGVALQGVAFDNRLASFLIDPTKMIPHRLDQLVKEFLHRTVHPLKSVVGSGKKEIPFSEAPLEKQSDYACHLADAVSEMQPLVAEALEEVGLTAHLHDVDLPLSWVLGQMEVTGILVDKADLAALGVEFQGRLDGIVTKIHDLAGHPFNVNSTKQLSTVLFEELKLPVIKKTKTGYSTKLEVLERLAPEHPIAALIVEQRQLAKLINTYTDVLQRSAHPETGRVHSTFQQTVGATGRLITTDPDLQRTPVKTPEGERIRKAFVAPAGHQLLSADWSQAELRLLAHVSKDPVLCGAFRDGVDVHAQTAAKLFDCAIDAVTKDQRRVGKTVNFATTYGQGATALGQILKIPRRDAKKYIEGYFTAFAGVRAWLDQTIADAQETGYVTTLLGRRRIIPELTSHNVMIRQAGTRIAANTPLQGGVADLCKRAMLRVSERFEADGLDAKMLLQVHDELIFEVPDAEVERVSAIVKEVMESVIELDVPLVADVGVGASWAEAH